MCANAALNTQCAADKTPFFGDVCVLGLGVTGQAVVDYFLGHPKSYQSLTVYAGNSTSETFGFIKKLPNDIAVYLDEQTVTGSFDTTVVSPGISPLKTLYQTALACSESLISEPELAWRISPEHWIAITGTNGKTTVTELTAHLLNSGGVKAHLVGNIGTPCIDYVDQRQPGDYMVAELSSYQLHSTIDFCPEIAVLLNITPDHLNWHGSHQDYINDKLKILANLNSNSTAIVDATLSDTRQAVIQLRAKNQPVIPLGTRDGIGGNMVERCNALAAAFLNRETQTLEIIANGQQYSLLDAAELQIKGEHNVSNALAAAAAALAVGVSPQDIAIALSNFKPLENRFEPCGVVNGICFINDSKATNTDAAIKALLAFGSDPVPRVLAMLGGLDKGTSLDELVKAAQGTCKHAICYGEAKDRFYDALSPKVSAVKAKDFKQAFTQAVQLAQLGDVVLLSPACASFDEFASFEARGQAFKALVSQLSESNQSNQPTQQPNPLQQLNQGKQEAVGNE